MLEGLSELYDVLCGPVIDDDERLKMLRRRRRLRSARGVDGCDLAAGRSEAPSLDPGTPDPSG